MPRKYEGGEKGRDDLKKFFPSARPPEPGVFEIAIAAAGGTSTGAYVAGVLDFLVEALDNWETWREGRITHAVRVNVLTGTSAGALGVGLAAQFTLKHFPPVYHSEKWAKLQPSDQVAEQPLLLNPLYLAWVHEIDLTKLLAPPDPKVQDIALFAPAPEAVRDTTFTMMSVQPERAWPAWARTPLEMRLTVTNLRGVPYSLDFRNLRSHHIGERLTLHQDHVAFALSTTEPDHDTVWPDAHILTQSHFNSDRPAWALLKSASIASSAIPLVFAPIAVKGQSPDAYDWRDSYYDTELGVPVLNLPAWRTSPASIDFTAADGGVLNNSPFMLAHKALAGVRGSNPQDAKQATRAVILIAPIVEDHAQDPTDPILADPTGPPPESPSPIARLMRAALRVVTAPMEQAQLAAFDLGQAKSDAIFSRYMICPAREHPGVSAKTMMGPSRSLMSLPVHAIMGFAAKPYRKHDYFLGRRNAQQFLARHFRLPLTNPLVKNIPPGSWLSGDVQVEDGHSYVPIIPLRGASALEEPLPDWDWEALTPEMIAAFGNAFQVRAQAIWKQSGRAILQALPQTWTILEGPLRFLVGVGLWLVWRWGLRRTLTHAFTTALARGRNSLNPASIPASDSPPARPSNAP